ncbi:hypothetical protein [Piscinibacter gummiphilus]|uniref:Holin n=1 Tax=Piscinibacter gummiphilus TaxID=946333 RepID=A0ABZ0D7F0_9BURK|nr:hypothetical protein [Piscinibacter gummiphilus]WOB11202.1 hypothetical protein RXV79_26580 [Piscinibacter gummiphilus]
MAILGFLFVLVVCLGVAINLVDWRLRSVGGVDWQLQLTSATLGFAAACAMFGVWYFGYEVFGGPYWLQVGEWLMVVFFASRAAWSAANGLVALFGTKTQQGPRKLKETLREGDDRLGLRRVR